MNFTDTQKKQSFTINQRFLYYVAGASNINVNTNNGSFWIKPGSVVDMIDYLNSVVEIYYLSEIKEGETKEITLKTSPVAIENVASDVNVTNDLKIAETVDVNVTNDLKIAETVDVNVTNDLKIAETVDVNVTNDIKIAETVDVNSKNALVLALAEYGNVTSTPASTPALTIQDTFNAIADADYIKIEFYELAKPIFLEAEDFKFYVPAGNFKSELLKNQDYKIIPVDTTADSPSYKYNILGFKYE